MLFQKGDGDGHVKFFGQTGIGADEGAAGRDRPRFQFMITGRDLEATAPHLRE